MVSCEIVPRDTSHSMSFLYSVHSGAPISLLICIPEVPGSNLFRNTWFTYRACYSASIRPLPLFSRLRPFISNRTIRLYVRGGQLVQPRDFRRHLKPGPFIFFFYWLLQPTCGF
jgi:hypothetical protein